jgi:hypothetical protein
LRLVLGDSHTAAKRDQPDRKQSQEFHVRIVADKTRNARIAGISSSAGLCRPDRMAIRP